MTFASLFNDLVILGVLLLVGFAIREIARPLQRLFLSASLIGGVIALIVGQQVIGLVEIPTSFSSYSGTLINVMLTCMCFGVTLNKKKIKSALDYCFTSQSIYGVQMFIGPILGLALCAIWKGLPKEWGSMGVFAFHGGPGTSAAAGAVYKDLGLPDLLSVGIVLATIGIIAAMLVGMLVVNIGVRKGWTTFVKVPAKDDKSALGGPLPEEKRAIIGKTVTSSIGINHLALQFGWICLAYFLGKELMALLALVWPTAATLPAMINGIIGGTILWPILVKLGLNKFVDKKAINQISSFCMEVIVLSVVATLNIKFVATYFAPLLIYSVIMIALTTFLCIYLPYKWSEVQWFEKATMATGHTLGTGAQGFALLRAVDPNSESEIGEDHGIYSALSNAQNLLPALVPVWMMSGPKLTIGVGFIMMAACMFCGWFFYGRHNIKAKREQNYVEK